MIMDDEERGPEMGAVVRRLDLRTALPKVQGRGQRTTEAYRRAVLKFLSSDYPPTVLGFAQYITELKDKRKYSAATINQVLAAGRKAFLQASQEMGMSKREVSIIRGSLASISRVKQGPPEVSTVTPEERSLLFKALPLRIRLIAEVLYITGARITEVLEVQRKHIKTNGSVELRLMGKGQKERTAKIPASLYRRILAEYPDGKYLFETGGGQKFRRSYVSREIARASHRVLGRMVTAHTLRHSRATDLLATTHRIKAVSRLLGHADESTTLHYYVKDSFSDEELFSGIEDPQV